MTTKPEYSIALIGNGAIASHVIRHCPDRVRVCGVICRPGREDDAKALLGELPVAASVAGLPVRPDVLVDCAGHAGLRAHGVDALRSGIEVLTVSVGALADASFQAELASAAQAGGTKLRLATGAIGALDALAAAAEGETLKVTYRGRKPIAGWRGSRAEDVLELDQLDRPTVHFSGTARDAAQLYPKNANVAAAVALAGVGMDDTRAELIADPTIQRNIHEIEAAGSFGTFRFEIEGEALPGNPKSSALTAMSLIRALKARLEHIQI